MAEKVGIVVAITSATFYSGPTQVRVRAGEAWSATSPVVRKHPEMFSDDHTRALGADIATARRVPTADVEQKTAAPGEKSNVVHP